MCQFLFPAFCRFVPFIQFCFDAFIVFLIVDIKIISIIFFFKKKGHHKSNNSGPNLTGELEIVANRIFIIEDNQPVNLTNLFMNATYVSDNTYTKSEVDNLLVPKANAADYYNKSQTDILSQLESKQHRYDKCFEHEG